jgi:hypothetical protein
MTTANACFCGSTETRPYAEGHLCGDHTPAKRAGRPEPDSERWCAPLRCYCGTCPGYVADTPYRDGETIVDIRAVASGKRRSSLTQYRNAQTNTGGAA